MLQNNIIRQNHFLILQYNAYLWVLIHFSPNNIVRKYYSLSIVYLLCSGISRTAIITYYYCVIIIITILFIISIADSDLVVVVKYSREVLFLGRL
jgi:hypothetical protein